MAEMFLINIVTLFLEGKKNKCKLQLKETRKFI